MSNLAEAVQTGGKRIRIFGFIAMALGVLAMLVPAVAGISIVLLLGVLVMLSGVLRMLWAFGSGSLGRGVWMFVLGTLTFVCGAAMLANPLFGSGVLAILLVAYFAVDGIAEIAAGVGRFGEGGGWLVFAGIVSLLLAGLIWAQFPLSGAWAMGILLGIKLFFVGLTMIVGGTFVRSLGANR
jgi:uncharacterized membrane protein HdeD (DUF308 family)